MAARGATTLAVQWPGRRTDRRPSINTASQRARSSLIISRPFEQNAPFRPKAAADADGDASAEASIKTRRPGRRLSGRGCSMVNGEWLMVSTARHCGHALRAQELRLAAWTELESQQTRYSSRPLTLTRYIQFSTHWLANTISLVGIRHCLYCLWLPDGVNWHLRI